MPDPESNGGNKTGCVSPRPVFPHCVEYAAKRHLLEEGRSQRKPYKDPVDGFTAPMVTRPLVEKPPIETTGGSCSESGQPERCSDRSTRA